jgi:hypothetical protein
VTWSPDFVATNKVRPSLLAVSIRRYRFLKHQLMSRAKMDRKADTRHKVQLGGIVVKAGAGHVDAFALLGLLVEQIDRLNDPLKQQQLRQLGRAFHERTTRAKQESAHDDLAV